MYTYNYSYGYSLGYGGGYNPYINYTWQMLPNAKVKNSGTSGVDLQLYSGNPLDFQATQGIQVNKSFTLSGNAISLYLGFDTDSIAITHTLAEFDNLKVSIVNAVLRVTINAVNHDVATLSIDTYYQTEIVVNNNNLTVKLNGTQTYSASCTALNTTMLKSIGANDGLASGRFDGQLDYFIVYNGLTTFSLPNQFFKDMSTDVNTLFCTDFGGNSGYVADDRNVSKVDKSPLVTDWTVNPSKGTIEIIDNTIKVTSTALYDARAILVTDGTKYRAISINYTLFANSGSNGFLIGTALNLKATIRANGTYTDTIIVTPDGISNVQVGWYGATEEIGDYFIINSFELVELSNIYPITNYSSTMRTNFQTETTGMQNLMIERDSLGFFLELREFPKGNGVGVANTEWIPDLSSDFTIEWIQYKLNYTWQVNTGKSYFVGGIWVYNDNDFYFGEVNTGSFSIRIGSSGVSIGNDLEPMVANKRYLITCSFLASNQTLTMTINNGLYVKSAVITNYISTGKTLYLFSQYHQYTPNKSPLTTELSKFKVHNKVLTQEEITKNYNDYVAQGLLI